MTKEYSKAQKITLASLFTATAIVFGYIEFLIPFNFGIPGIKLGLANLVAVVLLYISDKKTTVTVSVLRVCMSALLFGTFYSFSYSAIGTLLSIAVMMLLRRIKGFSPVGISVAGGVSHNIGQLIVALIMFDTSEILYYLPVLLIAGAITGAVIGICSLPIIKKLEKLHD